MRNRSSAPPRRPGRAAAANNRGDEVVARLTEFHDVLTAGEDVAGRFRVTAREAVIPEPKPYDAAAVATLRGRLNVSQAVFARVVGVSPVLARQWESGVRRPSALACRLFEFIDRQPDLVRTWLRPAATV